jgi:hypothetical protein
MNSVSHDFFFVWRLFEEGMESFSEQLVYHQAALAFPACSNSMVKVPVYAAL